MRSLVLASIVVATAIGCSNVIEVKGVVYDERFGNSTAMDVYLPDNAETGRPGVLWIHGGGWSSFHRDVHTDHAIRLARAGYVSATIDYRLVPEGVYTDLVKDCFCALAHFRANADAYGLDPDRVAIAGYSAGGHLVSMLGTTYDLDETAPDCGAGPAACDVADSAYRRRHAALSHDSRYRGSLCRRKAERRYARGTHRGGHRGSHSDY